jgi:hypothetical protein
MTGSTGIDGIWLHHTLAYFTSAFIWQARKRHLFLMLMDLKIVNFIGHSSPCWEFLFYFFFYNHVEEKCIIPQKKKVLFVIYCWNHDCMSIYTAWREKKKIILFFKFKRHAIHKPGGGGGNTIVSKVIARYFLLSYSQLQLPQLLQRQPTVTRQPTWLTNCPKPLNRLWTKPSGI